MPDTGLLEALLSAAAVRRRCRDVLAAIEDGEGRYFRLRADRLDAAADFVVEVIRRRYPSLTIPPHSRWRHFSCGGVDRWRRLATAAGAPGSRERARRRLELAIISVLLDAGAGAGWRYRDPISGACYGRSEGLAAASFDWLAGGGLVADAAGLAGLNADDVARAFQSTADNPLLGIEGRLALLHRLAKVLAAAPATFGPDGRLGRYADHLFALSRDGRLQADRLLGDLLRTFAAIWPSGLSIDGIALGDVGRHDAVRAADPTNGLVPFHKLSQWLCYSLLEPLAEAGLTIVNVDALTGLAEYRNGGLFIDTGVLALRDPALAEAEHDARGPLVVEWRAATVALLDRLAGPVNARLQPAAGPLMLAQILEGGTWAAGREIAALRRGDGSPPLRLISDATVF